jgi:hypothetical protein
VRDEVVLTDQAERGLVRVVEPPATHLAVQLGDLLHRALVVARALVPADTREPAQRLLGGFELVSGAPAAAGIVDKAAA